MLKSYLKPLANCSLKNGILTVPNLNTFEYVKLATELRNAIINYEIPHWKIVAIQVSLPNLSQLVDFVTKPKGVSKSYAELIPVLKKVVASRGGGQPAIVRNVQNIDADCFYKVNGDMAFISDTEGVVNTYDGNLTYESFPSKAVKFLCDVDIIETESSIVRAIMYRGSGLVDFNESQEIIQAYRNNVHVIASGMPKTAYCPMSVVYDLSQFVTVRIPTGKENQVKLLYKSKIDEELLEDILRQFGSEL